jgi:anti-anti-sigma factor
MGIQNWSDNIIVVDLPPEPEIVDELKTVTEMARDRADVDVVIDFSDVDIVTSSGISSLLRLRKLLSDCSHRLIFCNIAPATKSVFVTTGVEEIFEFADDKFLALTSLQMVN